MLIKFKTRQKLKDMCQNYQAWLDQDERLTEEECDEIIDVIAAIETAVSCLEEE